MPLLHCKNCHHEWEDISKEGKCSWCGGGSDVLVEKIELEEMFESDWWRNEFLKRNCCSFDVMVAYGSSKSIVRVQIS